MQATGTVMLIWSTTEGLSAETVLETRIVPNINIIMIGKPSIIRVYVLFIICSFVMLLIIA